MAYLVHCPRWKLAFATVCVPWHYGHVTVNFFHFWLQVGVFMVLPIHSPNVFFICIAKYFLIFYYSWLDVQWSVLHTKCTQRYSPNLCTWSKMTYLQSNKTYHRAHLNCQICLGSFSTWSMPWYFFSVTWMLAGAWGIFCWGGSN